MRRFENKRILVAITGGIAAYKACDLIRMLYREGASEVVAMLSPSAQAFITPMTL
jgi:phosphopantothenoylcysteine decarboxylase / phosphopantothenate---cysteine ligase